MNGFCTCVGHKFSVWLMFYNFCRSRKEDCCTRLDLRQWCLILFAVHASAKQTMSNSFWTLVVLSTKARRPMAIWNYECFDRKNARTGKPHKLATSPVARRRSAVSKTGRGRKRVNEHRWGWWLLVGGCWLVVGGWCVCVYVCMCVRVCVCPL